MVLYAAEHLGYFKAEGLNCQFSDFEGGAEVTTAMVGGSIDTGGTMAERPLILAEKGFGAKNLVDVRSPDEYAGRLLAPAHLPQEQAQRAGQIIQRIRSFVKRSEPNVATIRSVPKMKPASPIRFTMNRAQSTSNSSNNPIATSRGTL